MGVFDWYANPDANGSADPLVPSLDGTSARQLAKALRGVQAGVAAYALDQGGALVAKRMSGNVYAVVTRSKPDTLKAGFSCVVRADTPNTGAAVNLLVDGFRPYPWRDENGFEFPVGSLTQRAVRIVFDADGQQFLSDFSISSSVAAHAGRTDNPHSVTKGQVGLGNADNTADVDKPLSTAQAAADAAVQSVAATDAATKANAAQAAAIAVSAQRLANLGDLADKDASLANLNGLDRRILALTADPTTAAIPVSTIRVAKNTATGRLSLWANDGGTMVDLLTLNAV